MENYFKYINLRSGLNKLNDKHGLDIKDELILDHLALITQAGEVIKVGDLISIRQLGSQATIHARLGNLIERGFVRKKEGSESDLRGKHLSLGKKGKARAKEIHQLMGEFR